MLLYQRRRAPSDSADGCPYSLCAVRRRSSREQIGQESSNELDERVALVARLGGCFCGGGVRGRGAALMGFLGWSFLGDDHFPTVGRRSGTESRALERSHEPFHQGRETMRSVERWRGEERGVRLERRGWLTGDGS